MKKIIIYSLVVLPILASAQVVDINLLKAKACMDQNKPDSSLTLLYSTKPSFEKALLLGNCYYQKKSYPQACRFYLLADSIKQGNASYELAKSYARMNNTVGAASWLKKYLSIPYKISKLEIIKDSAFRSISNAKEWKQVWQTEWYSPAEIGRNAIISLLYKEKITEAQTELDADEGKQLSRHEYYYLQARIYDKQHLPELALASMAKAVTFNSSSAAYLAQYASSLKTSKKYPEALESISKAIRLNPYDPEYYLQRGEIARLARDYAQSEKDLKLFKELYPNNAEVYHQLGLLETEQGNRQNAMDYYDILINKDKVHAQYFIERGKLALQLSQIQKADEDFSLALDLNPNAQEAYLNKGETLFMLNDNSGACFYWTKARELGSSEAATLIQSNRCKEQ